MIDHSGDITITSGILESLSLEIVKYILRLASRMESLPETIFHGLLKKLARSNLEKRHFSSGLRAWAATVFGSLKGCPTE